MRKSAVIGAMVICTLAVFALIGFGAHSSASNSTTNLKLLHVILRHGARTPADTFPKDPHINESLYPVGWGQLTNVGKLELYNLGKYLRTRYGDFLGSYYSPEEYYVQTTDVDRTKASAQSINAGLWPPASSQIWGPINWQPIPVHSEPLEQDHLLLVRRPCPQYHLELEKVIASEEIQRKFEQNEKLFGELSELTGKSVKNFDDVQDIYSTLKAEETYNLTIADFMKPYYPEKMYEPTVFSYILNAYTDKLKRLKGGVLLKKLIADWRSKIDEPTSRRAILYVGHDSTIVNIMQTLNVWEPQLPEFGITVLFELSVDRITNRYGVEVFLKKLTEEPELLTIPGCESFCTLEKLTELTRNVIPTNWEEECKSDDPDYVPPPPGGP